MAGADQTVKCHECGADVPKERAVWRTAPVAWDAAGRPLRQEKVYLCWACDGRMKSRANWRRACELYALVMFLASAGLLATCCFPQPSGYLINPILAAVGGCVLALTGLGVWAASRRSV